MKPDLLDPERGVELELDGALVQLLVIGAECAGLVGLGNSSIADSEGEKVVHLSLVQEPTERSLLVVICHCHVSFVQPGWQPVLTLSSRLKSRLTSV